MSRTGTCQDERDGVVGSMTVDEPAHVTTTLYEVITTLQSVAEPDADDLVVGVVVQWLRSGRLTASPVRQLPSPVWVGLG